MSRAFAAIGRLFVGCNDWLEKADQSRLGGAFVFAAIVCLSIWRTAPLVDRNYEYTFEPDSDATLSISTGMAKAVLEANRRHVPRVSWYPPYFDVQFVLYAVAGIALRLGSSLRLYSLDFLATDDAWMIFTIRYVNAALAVVSGALFQKTVKMLTHSNWLALLIGALFVFNAQTSEIDLMRVDHVVMPCFLLTALCTFAVIDQPSNSFRLAALGIAMALLFQTKLNAVMLGILPGAALVMLYRKGDVRLPQVRVALVPFLAVSVLLLARYFYSYKTVLGQMAARVEDLRLWYRSMGREPSAYYNWHYFFDSGDVFLALFAVCLATVVFAQVRKPSIAGWTILIALVSFSALGWFSPKMSRWGIHFVPVYLWIVALGLAAWGRALHASTWTNRMGAVCAIALATVVLLPLDSLWAHHRKFVGQVENRRESMDVTRFQPRQWFQQNAKPGDRVAWYAHTWAQPPIFDLGLDFSYLGLTYPYLKKDEIEAFSPPTFDQLESAVDIVLLEDFHRDAQLSQLKSLGLAKQHDAWSAFYKSLDERYRRVQFKSEHSNYGIREVVIYDLAVRPGGSRVRQNAGEGHGD